MNLINEKKCLYCHWTYYFFETGQRLCREPWIYCTYSITVVQLACAVQGILHIVLEKQSKNKIAHISNIYYLCCRKYGGAEPWFLFICGITFEHLCVGNGISMSAVSIDIHVYVAELITPLTRVFQEHWFSCLKTVCIPPYQYPELLLLKHYHFFYRLLLLYWLKKTIIIKFSWLFGEFNVQLLENA